MKKNQIKAIGALMEAIQWLFNNDDTFKNCFNERIELYFNSLSDKDKIKFKTSLMSFTK